MRPSTAALAVAIHACTCIAAHAAEPTATAIEFYNAALNHYFVTAYPEEAAMLDAGVVVRGWTRTGARFSVWAQATDRPTAVPVCRFYGTPERGPNSHFYTADVGECALVKQNADWTYEGIAFYVDVPQGTACASGTTPVYRSFYPGAIVAQSNHRFTVDLTVHQKMAAASILEGVVMCAALSSAEIEADAVRLLEQSTFGPTRASIDHVKSIGAAAWLAEQFAAPVSRYSAYKYVPAGAAVAFCATDPDPYCYRDYYSMFLVQNEFFRQALAAPDQLRQRVAFALSQILVTSGLEVNFAYAMAGYQQAFRDYAFGNYADVLTRVTLSSVMGDYLNMVNNDKPIGEVEPNENYARELMQLFSIGVWELKPDGTLLLDANGAPIPTYDQDVIEGYAHAFTGWTYPPLPGAPSRTHNPRNYLADMVGVESNHDTGPKTLLDDVVTPAGQPMSADLATAIDTVFRHPNVGPFIGRQLIQKLVTGDPTPQYVARVAAAFNDNGAGVRGDLRAVVTAVLLDPEARGALKIDPGYGKLREPVLYLTGMARALDTASDGVYFTLQSAALGQNLFNPASVFNYYPPTYVVPGTTLNGPEFALQNSSTAINRYNAANGFAFGNIAPIATLPGAIGTQPDWSALTALAANTDALLDELDECFTHRTMSAAMRGAIKAAVEAVPASLPATRAQTALYLVATSSAYQVER